MTPADRGGMLCDWRNRYGAWPGKDVTPENAAFQQGFECGLAHAREQDAAQLEDRADRLTGGCAGFAAAELREQAEKIKERK